MISNGIKSDTNHYWISYLQVEHRNTRSLVLKKKCKKRQSCTLEFKLQAVALTKVFGFCLVFFYFNNQYFSLLHYAGNKQSKYTNIKTMILSMLLLLLPR